MKKMILLNILLVSNLAISAEMPPVPEGFQPPDIIWNAYCSGPHNDKKEPVNQVERLSTEIPVPNYENDRVAEVARKLVTISPFSYYFYAGPLSAYNLVNFVEDPITKKKKRELVNAPAEISKIFRGDSASKIQVNSQGLQNTHAFLTILCGEFRDRPTLIEEKLKWVQKMNTLDDKMQSQRPFLMTENSSVWDRLTGASYSKYIKLTKQIFAAKEKAIEKNQERVKNVNTMTGNIMNEKRGVEPFSVCETKFILSRYVGKELPLPMVKKNGKKATIDEDDEDYYDAMSNGAATVNLQQYKSDYAKFTAKPKQGNGNCSKEEMTSFYDFRGDSNFKPNSPESNGMIWYSSTIGNACQRKGNEFVLKANAPAHLKADPEICNKYFSEPFRYRWSAARAGLAAWMMRDTKYDNIFEDSKANVTVIPTTTPDKGPFWFRFEIPEPRMPDLYIPWQVEADGNIYSEEWGDIVTVTTETDPVTGQVTEKKTTTQGYVKKKLEGQELADAIAENAQYAKNHEKEMARYNELMANRPSKDPILGLLPDFQNKMEEYWKLPDLGFNTIAGISKANKHKTGFAQQRIQDAVNRHTDWYASAYDDGAGKLREQAYSPFVASSYEMSASDGFTAPGVTVNSPADGCKHWMFIFRLPMSSWYSVQKVHEGVPLDFNKHWFDETSFGTNHLADHERALDRLGTTLEGEMDSILYLNNLNTSGQVQMNCGEDRVAELYPEKK